MKAKNTSHFETQSISSQHQNSSAKMLDIFRGLKNLIKVNHISTDSPVFRLHYSITVMILMSFSLIVTTRQYVGNPIDCVHTKDLPEDVLNTYCWIHSTYTLKSLFRRKVGSEVPYPGIGNSEGKMNDRKTYKYYQWVCFCLFFQVICQHTDEETIENWARLASLLDCWMFLAFNGPSSTFYNFRYFEEEKNMKRMPKASVITSRFRSFFIISSAIQDAPRN